MTPTVEEGLHSIPIASWFMDPRTLALRTVRAKGRPQSSRWIQTLWSGSLKEEKYILRGAILYFFSFFLGKIQKGGGEVSQNQKCFWCKHLYSSFFLIRGAADKTELSLVDKIELARTYQPMTGRKIWTWYVKFWGKLDMPNEQFQSTRVSRWTSFGNMPSIQIPWGALHSKPVASTNSV